MNELVNSWIAAGGESGALRRRNVSSAPIHPFTNSPIT